MFGQKNRFLTLKYLCIIFGLLAALTIGGYIWYTTSVTKNDVATIGCSYMHGMVPEGASSIFYTARTVEIGSSCTAISQERTCSNGKLLGEESYNYDTRTVLERFTGINFNRHPEELDIALMNTTGATWMRANADILTYIASSSYDFSNWNTFTTAHTQGKKGIVNLMWDFERYNERIPAPNSKREQELFLYLDTVVLPTLLPVADIIVAGNEPFVNTLKEDWVPGENQTVIPVATFYMRVAEHLDQYMRDNKIRAEKQLYIGAFTRLFSDTMQTGEGAEAVRTLLTFADQTPYIDGIDIHTHVTDLEDIESSLKFVTSISKKPIINTEYTYVHSQSKYTDQKIGVGDRGKFAKKYNLSSEMTVTEFMKAAVEKPISKQMWDDFFMSRPWTIDHFIIKSDDVFKRYAVHGVTFGFIQTDVNFRNPLPWYMNSLFTAATVERLPNGQPQGNYQYLTDFQSLQR